MMRVLVSGASGFIGRPLISFLKSRAFSIETLSTQSSTILWDPAKEKARQKDFEDFDAVIHLAGEPITLSRWTKEKREKILTSRSEHTLFLSRLLSSCLRPPKVFISASAVGFYGDREDELLREDSAPGSTFLAEVCMAWEKATSPLKERGVRTVQTRFGIVIGPDGGVLQKLLPIYKLGLGGAIGSGKHWISWIERSDLIHAISFILDQGFIEGPVNLVSPNPIQQAEFSKLLATLLHRPHFLHTPAPLLRLVFGATADELLLASQRVVPAKLLAANFSFKYPDLRSALKGALRI